MIQLGPKPPVPPTLQSGKVNRAYREIEAKVANGEVIKSKEDFPGYWIEDDVRLTLWEYQQRKCCYCERMRDPKREPDIEHFRPKTEIAGEVKPGYWWLAYNWDNLFFCCRTCNQVYKKTQFPIRGVRAIHPDDDLELEDPVLPHPQHENPEKFIGWKWVSKKPEFVWPIGIDDDNKRGSEIIRILGLDRTDLCEERGSKYLQDLEGIVNGIGLAMDYNIKKFIEFFAQRIEEETVSNKEFVGFRRAFFRSAGLGEYVSND